LGEVPEVLEIPKALTKKGVLSGMATKVGKRNLGQVKKIIKVIKDKRKEKDKLLKDIQKSTDKAKKEAEKARKKIKKVDQAVIMQTARLAKMKGKRVKRKKKKGGAVKQLKRAEQSILKQLEDF